MKEKRINELEAEGMSTSDAQAVLAREEAHVTEEVLAEMIASSLEHGEMGEYIREEMGDDTSITVRHRTYGLKINIGSREFTLTITQEAE